MDIRTREDVLLVLEQHWKWLLHPERGKCAKFKDVDFSEMEIDFSGLDLRKVEFEKCNLYGVNFCNANLAEATFNESQVSCLSMQNANLYSVKFIRCTMLQVNFIDANVERTAFAGGKFHKCNFHKAKLIDRFYDCDFSDIVLRDARIRLLLFKNCALCNANISGEWCEIITDDCDERNMVKTNEIEKY